MNEKRLRKQVRVYQVLCFALLILFMVFFIVQDHIYGESVEQFDKVCETLDIARATHDRQLKEWQDSYEELEKEYGALLVEKSELEKEVKDLKKHGVKVPKYSYTLEDVELLASCVQCEVGESDSKAQKYACSVIMNRVKSSKFPNTIKEVVYEKHGNIPQFSVAYNGSMDNLSKPCDLVKLNCYRVLMFGSVLPDKVMYFYSESVDENWVNGLNTYEIVDGSVFAYE